MSRLREASAALARTGGHRVLPVERLFAIERAAAALEARRIGLGEPWATLAARASEAGVATLSASELRRLLAGIWRDRGHADLAAEAIARIAGLARRSGDRALITAYLRDYPVDHRGFEPLRAAAAIAAERHDWRWREAGRRWRLWEGTDMFGEALGTAGDPQALLREAGLVGRLGDGGFVRAARADPARTA